MGGYVTPLFVCLGKTREDAMLLYSDMLTNNPARVFGHRVLCLTPDEIKEGIRVHDFVVSRTANRHSDHDEAYRILSRSVLVANRASSEASD